MPNYSGSFTAKVTSQSFLGLSEHGPGQSYQQLVLTQITGPQQSADPMWNDAQLTYWSVADLMNGSGHQEGYWVNQHADGDRDWGTFEGRVISHVSQVYTEGTFKTTGGTGKFAGITGTGTYKGTFSSPTELHGSWAGSYQLGAAIAAGGNA